MLTHTPIRVAVLCSRRAPGLLHLLTEAERRPHNWAIVCCVTSEERFEDEDLVRQHDVPVVHHPLRRFRGEYAPQVRLSDLTLRAAYDGATVEILEPYQPDLILLAGYLLLLTSPMLTAFDNRILNVHHSDLQLRNADGGPRYPGLRAVRDAILAGELETRSTVHLVNAALDAGVPLLRSEAYPVSELAAWALAEGEGARDVLKREIRVHETWMLRDAFGPLMEQALDMLSAPSQHAMAS